MIGVRSWILFRSGGPVRRHLKKVIPQIRVGDFFGQLDAIRGEAHAFKLELCRVIRHVVPARIVNDAEPSHDRTRRVGGVRHRETPK